MQIIMLLALFASPLYAMQWQNNTSRNIFHHLTLREIGHDRTRLSAMEHASGIRPRGDEQQLSVDSTMREVEKHIPHEALRGSWFFARDYIEATAQAVNARDKSCMRNLTAALHQRCLAQEPDVDKLVAFWVLVATRTRDLAWVKEVGFKSPCVWVLGADVDGWATHTLLQYPAIRQQRADDMWWIFVETVAVGKVLLDNGFSMPPDRIFSKLSLSAELFAWYADVPGIQGINLIDYTGSTPLYAHIRHRLDVDRVRILLEHDADVDTIRNGVGEETVNELLQRIEGDCLGHDNFHEQDPEGYEYLQKIRSYIHGRAYLQEAKRLRDIGI